MAHDSTVANNSRGRPAGGSDARGRIIDAARELFLAQGFAATSVREIARRAGVHHTLVKYHFGSKEHLFGEVMGLVRSPSDVIAEVIAGTPPERLPRELLTQLMIAWETPAVGGPMRALFLEAARTPELTGVIAGYIENTLIAWLEETIPGRYARHRATACALSLAGLVLGRYAFAVPAFVALSQEEILRFYGPVVEAAFFGPGGRATAHTGPQGPVRS